jgi:hypothetical protein
MLIFEDKQGNVKMIQRDSDPLPLRLEDVQDPDLIKLFTDTKESECEETSTEKDELNA